MNLKKYLLLPVAAIAFAACSQTDDTERRIDDLLSQMTLGEKLGQMNQLTYGEEEWARRPDPVGCFRKYSQRTGSRHRQQASEDSRRGDAPGHSPYHFT